MLFNKVTIALSFASLVSSSGISIHFNMIDEAAILCIIFCERIILSNYKSLTVYTIYTYVHSLGAPQQACGSK